MDNSIDEPSSGNHVVKLDVIREFGAEDVVRFEWEVTLAGKLATNDVQRTQGSGLIPLGHNTTSFDIVILLDDIPEINAVGIEYESRKFATLLNFITLYYKIEVFFVTMS